MTPVNLLLIAITAILSWMAFNNRKLADRLILWPPAIDRHRQYDRLVTYGFIHADWSHLLGNLVFLLIFGLPAERVLGPWRLLLLFLVGGAVSNLVAIYTMGSPDQIIIGASGAVSALIGAYLALFPGARLGVVIPLGLFLEFVRAPAYLLIGVWAALQVVFAHIGPSFGMVAWWAHIGGFVFGVVYGVYVRAAIARRLRKRHGF